ncbi:hypothetical protein ACIBO5_48110 [Nonomuraea angiospora]
MRKGIGPGRGVDWSSPSLPQLMTMLRWLVDELMPPHSGKPTRKVPG